MTKLQEKQIHEEIVEGIDDKETIPFKYDITSYGADYPVDALVKRLKRDSIYIPKFQRDYVWTQRDASRFVESLLLGLPVPNIFLARDDDNRLLVIDGQQRLRTLQYFFDEVFHGDDKPFVLQGVTSEFAGKTYSSLHGADQIRLDDYIIHVIIVEQRRPTNDKSSIYHIFERLNTGGKKLYPQEIRACIYHGKFNELLQKLNKNSDWRELYGKEHKRLRDQELILRFLAFYNNHKNYKKPMKGFLNNYMAKHRYLDTETSYEFQQQFESVVKFINQHLGHSAFRPIRNLNSSVMDAVTIGIAERLKYGNITDIDMFKKNHANLLANESFKEIIQSGTADDKSVHKRINMGIEAFKNIS